jgi:hypothetical protein
MDAMEPHDVRAIGENRKRATDMKVSILCYLLTMLFVLVGSYVNPALAVLAVFSIAFGTICCLVLLVGYICYKW